MKILINTCFGGFGLSEKVREAYRNKTGKDLPECSSSICRTDPNLISVVEQVGLEESAGWAAELKIIDIPNGIDYYIHDYDGIETIRERGHEWS